MGELVNHPEQAMSHEPNCSGDYGSCNFSKKYTKLRFGFSVLQDLPSGLCDGKTALDWAITRMNPSRQNFSIRYRSSTRTERMHD